VKVPGKVCLRQVTRGEKRKDRAEEKLFKFLLAYSKPSRAQSKQYELVTGRKPPKPLTEKEREAWAKKAFAQIKGRGLSELEMITITSLREEWFAKEFAKEKNDQQKRAWKKALETIEQNKDAALQAAIDSYQEKCRKDNESLSLR
jgi:hypothetical protein